MKPLFTKAGPPLSESLPAWCGAFAACLSKPNLEEAKTQKSEPEESVESFASIDNPSTYERNLVGEESNVSDTVVRQPVFAVDSRDIELTDGDLGLGERTFNPRS